MAPRRVEPNAALRALAWIASAGLHVVGIWTLIPVWFLILFSFLFFGIPADDTFAFRWDNPFFRRGSPTEDPDDGVVIAMPPRRLRPLPELEKPRHEIPWDSRKIPADDDLGEPSPFETSFDSPASAGFSKAVGDSLDFVSDKPHRGKGTYDTVGAGPGGGGRYGSAVILKDAVQVGLLWLARHQGADGSWSDVALPKLCGRALPNGREVSGPPCTSGSADDAVRFTAFAVAAFAGAGYRPDSPDVWDGIRYRDVIRRACDVLYRADGAVRPLALFALASLVRPPSPFDRPERDVEPVPDPRKLESLLEAVQSLPVPAEGTQEAVWWALALLSAAKADLEVAPNAIQSALAMLTRRCETLPVLAPADWPGDGLERAYLRLLASYRESRSRGTDLPNALELRTRLRSGQVRDSDTCREGSWDPPEGGSRLAATTLHLLALVSLPRYGFRGAHPLRLAPEEEEDPAIRLFLERRRQAAARLAEGLRKAPDALRRGIARVREARRVLPEADLDDTIRTAFEPLGLSYVRHVRTLEIGDHLESDDGEEFQKFKPLTRLGGSRDLLTPEIHELLSQGDGIVGVDSEWNFVVPAADDDLSGYGKTLIFTLPDGPTWSSYVVLGYAELR